MTTGRLPRQGETLELDVTDLDSAGQGIGRVGGVVVFVPGALPGDRVTVRVDRLRGGERGFAEAALVSVDRPGPGRVEPGCPVAQHCGGCQLLALSYPAQLAWKTSVVRETLRRVGRLGEMPVRRCLGARHPTGYRNKAQFPVACSVGPPAAGRPEGTEGGVRARRPQRRRRRLVAGLYRRGTHEVVPVDTCLLQHPVNNAVLAATVRLAAELGVEPYDEDSGRGLLRHVLARVSSDGREALAVLVTAGPVFPAGRRLAQALQRKVPQVRTVVQNVNTRRTNVVLGPRNIVLAGPGFITDRLGGLRFRVSASSFFQVNPEQAEALYRVVAAQAAGARRAADLYCGVGSITLFLARELPGLEEIVGVESDPGAVRDAVANAQSNGIANAGFVCGDAAAALREMAAARAAVDTVVLDPPRKGCEPALLEALKRLAPLRVVYVSCNPATLARDLAGLVAGGHTVKEVQPVDMFPQTVHVEVVALVIREDGRRPPGATHVQNRLGADGRKWRA